MPSSQTLSALQEKGFRTTFRGLIKMMCWLTSMHWTTKTGSTAQSRKSRLPSCKPSWIKCALNSPLHVPVWKSCKAIFQPLTSAPKLRKNRAARWSPVQIGRRARHGKPEPQ